MKNTPTQLPETWTSGIRDRSPVWGLSKSAEDLRNLTNSAPVINDEICRVFSHTEGRVYLFAITHTCSFVYDEISQRWYPSGRLMKNLLRLVDPAVPARINKQ